MADIDIGAELLEKIRKDFEQGCKNDKYVQLRLKKIADGTADFDDAARLSQMLGSRITVSISRYVKPENLPDGRLYYNIADTILNGTLKDNYDIINSVCADVQKNLDRRLGINIKPQKADFPQERVNALVNSVSDEKADWETIRRRLDAPVRNITESFYSDYVETNADFRSKSGLDVYIVRTDHNGCCDWCKGLAGRYRYPDDIPKDVYRRHDNCTCTVTYENGKQRQDVWSKNTWTADEETLGRRKELADKKPTVLTKEQAALREREVQEKYKKKVDISGESDIIKERNKKPVTKITDKAVERVQNVKIQGYTDEQCEFIQNQHKELLRYSRDNNENKEVAFIFDNSFAKRKEFLGDDDRLDFGNELYGNELFVMHNHPRNSSFSDTDIAFLLGKDNIKSLSVVKNNGAVEILAKTDNYRKDELILDFKRQYKKFVKTGSDAEIDKAVRKFIERNEEGLQWTKNR